MSNHAPNEKDLHQIWEQVPPDYYQKGVEKNILQRLWHTNKLRLVASAIKNFNDNPKSILDVGCASGWFLSQLSKIFPMAKLFGVDVYADAINYGKKHYKDIHFQCIDAHKLPFKSNSVDIIVCCEVLEHVVDVERVLEEMRRIIKPTGRVIVEIDSGNFLFKAVWFWWTNIRKGVWRDAHLHPFNIKILENLFIKNGFKIEKKKLFNATMAVVFTLDPSKN